MLSAAVQPSSASAFLLLSTVMPSPRWADMVDEIPVDSVGGDLLGGGSVEASGGEVAVAASGEPPAVLFGKGPAVVASGKSPAVASKTTEEETHAHKRTIILS